MLGWKQSQGQMEMESPTPRPSARAPTCAVPGLRASLAKLCTLSKVCSAPLLDEDDAKPRGGSGSSYGGYDQRLLLIRLFQTVGSLKSAYVKLQRAYVPYDAARIAAADEAITSELDSAAALQRLCDGGGCGGGVGALVNERWAQVQRLEAEARRRDADITRLKRHLERLRRENSRLRKKTRSKKEPAVTPAALLEQFKAAARSVGDFAEMFIGLLTMAAEAEQQPCMMRHSLEAHLWRALLGGGGGEQGELELELDDGDGFDGIMRLRDPLDALMRFPRSGFSRFCRRSYLAAVPAAAEAAAFRRSLDQRAFVLRGGHPRTWFYRAFATAARPAWALRVLMARCSEPESAHGRADTGVRVFYARRGSAYAAEYMKSVAAALDKEEGGEELGVAFTVTPGVKVGDTVVPARVLLCRRGQEQEGSLQIR